MKLVGFSQLNNELEKGNLLNWLKSMEICDFLYIYDQNSTDGSREVYSQHDNVRVIYSPNNDFLNEIRCKSLLLQLLLTENPDADWIFWMDGDTILERNLLNRNYIDIILNEYSKLEIDGINLGHYNLWRSDLYYRVDSDYDWLHNHGVTAFWRNNGNLSFPKRKGLHSQQFPDGISSIARLNGSLIHKGFSTDNQIITRYKNYKDRIALI